MDHDGEDERGRIGDEPDEDEHQGYRQEQHDAGDDLHVEAVGRVRPDEGPPVLVDEEDHQADDEAGGAGAQRQQDRRGQVRDHPEVALLLGRHRRLLQGRRRVAAGGLLVAGRRSSRPAPGDGLLRPGMRSSRPPGGGRLLWAGLRAGRPCRGAGGLIAWLRRSRLLGARPGRRHRRRRLGGTGRLAGARGRLLVGHVEYPFQWWTTHPSSRVRCAMAIGLTPGRR